MNHFFRLACWVTILGFTSCSTSRTATKKEDGKIEVVFVQVNDVYEIAPLSGGKEGGMARVATLKKQYLQRNPNTFLVMAGDFLSPSLFNSIRYEGKAVRGRQMVEAMNAAGTDLVVFGNHEFDIKENELQERINESAFHWVASNTFHWKNNKEEPFFKKTTADSSAFPRSYVLNLTDADGTAARIGFIGITLPFNKADYVHYTDPFAAAKEVYNGLKDSVDAVVAITHQSLEDDQLLAKELPGLAAILGGHEHDRRFVKQGSVSITKAHANAKSAYIVKLRLDKKKKKLKVEPHLEYLNEKISPDSATNNVVKKWTDIAANNFSSLGFDAAKVVIKSGEPLDGRETSVRSSSTNLTRIIVAAMAEAAPQADVVLLNSGSVRVDDYLHPPVTQYDILRALPYGGSIPEAEMKGSLLIKTLEQGTKNKNTGGFLQFSEAVNFDDASGKWKVKNMPIDTAKIYRVALNDFLLTGQEANMDFLNRKNPDVVKVYEAPAAPSVQSDVRLAIVKYLEKRQMGN